MALQIKPVSALLLAPLHVEMVWEGRHAELVSESYFFKPFGIKTLEPKACSAQTRSG
jgi:hypothetical protein